jgi:hypothetical protein
MREVNNHNMIVDVVMTSGCGALIVDNQLYCKQNIMGGGNVALSVNLSNATS